jgi:hypothetical protein
MVIPKRERSRQLSRGQSTVIARRLKSSLIDHNWNKPRNGHPLVLVAIDDYYQTIRKIVHGETKASDWLVTSGVW